MVDLLELGAGIPPLAIALAFLIPLAIAVYWYGNRRFGQQVGQGLAGRGRWGEGEPPVDATLRAEVRRLEARGRPQAIAAASAGWVMLRGTLCGADQTLGGPPERACVWRNRADGRRDAAVAAGLVFLRDASGQAAIEGLERALVIAPEESAGRGPSWVSLFLGDEVEVVGCFVPEQEGAKSPKDDAAARVYGSLGQDGKLHLRLVRRPPPARAPDTPASPDPTDLSDPSDRPAIPDPPDAPADDPVAGAPAPDPSTTQPKPELGEPRR